MLPGGLFRGLGSLLQLMLNGNELISLDQSTFNGLIRLTVLRLDENKLSTLPSGLLKGLKNLDKLYLNGNKLVWLNESTF